MNSFRSLIIQSQKSAAFVFAESCRTCHICSLSPTEPDPGHSGQGRERRKHKPLQRTSARWGWLRTKGEPGAVSTVPPPGYITQREGVLVARLSTKPIRSNENIYMPSALNSICMLTLLARLLVRRTGLAVGAAVSRGYGSVTLWKRFFNPASRSRFLAQLAQPLQLHR